MTIAGREKALGTLPVPSPDTRLGVWRAWAYTRLNAVFEASKEIPFDGASKLVFFSDCHRGDNSQADNFARNEALFMHVLDHYYRAGFSYVEVGDGDEMWKNGRFDDILHAHRRTFELLHQFDRQDRLHLVWGNHDVCAYQPGEVVKDGLVAEEGLILRHRGTGQRIFVVHGHQADFKSDWLNVVSRLAVRHVWRRLQLLGLDPAPRQWHIDQKSAQTRTIQGLKTNFRRFLALRVFQIQRNVERHIMAWAETHRQIVICGHTHRPAFARCRAVSYFNTGSCVVPGVVTGLEIENGEIKLVKWSSPAPTEPGAARFKRELMAAPRKLRLLL